MSEFTPEQTQTLTVALSEEGNPVTFDVKCDQNAFLVGLLTDPLQRAQWSDTQVQIINHIFKTVLITSASCFGTTVAQDGKSLTQIVFSGSTSCIYLQNMASFFVNLEPLLQSFLQSVVDFIQTKSNFELCSLNAINLIGCGKMITTFSDAFDLELNYLPKSFNIQSLQQPIQGLFTNITALVQAATSINQAVDAGQPTSSFEEKIVSTFQEINSILPQYTTVVKSFAEAVKQQFNCISQDEPVKPYFNELFSWTQSISTIFFQIVRVGLSDTASLDPVLALLFKIVQSLSELITKSIVYIKTKGEEIPQLIVDSVNGILSNLEPLLQALVASLQKCDPALQNSFNAALSPLFEVLGGINAKFQATLPPIITFFNSSKTTQRKSASTKDVISEIISTIPDLLKLSVNVESDSFVSTIKVEGIEIIIDKFSVIDEYIHQLVLDSETNEEKLRLLAHKQGVKYWVTLLLQQYQQLQAVGGNVILNQKLFLIISRSIHNLCTLIIDGVAACKELTNISDVLSEAIVQFYPINLKLILQVFTQIYSNQETLLGAEDCQEFSVLFALFSAQVQNSQQIFAQNSNAKDVTNVMNCLHAYDRWVTLLKGLYYGVQGKITDEGINQLLGIVELTIDNIELLISTYRVNSLKLIQIGLKTFAENIEPLNTPKFNPENEGVLSEQIHQLREIFFKSPPDDFYSQAYIDQLIGKFTEMLQNSTTLIGNAQSQALNSTERKSLSNTSLAIKVFAPIIQIAQNYYYDRSLELPSIVGYLFKGIIPKVHKFISEFSASDLNMLPFICFNILNSVDGFSNTFFYLNETQAIGEQINQLSSNLNIYFSTLGLGETSQIPEIENIFKQILEATTTIGPISEQLIQSMKETAKQVNLNNVEKDSSIKIDTNKYFMDIMNIQIETIKIILSSKLEKLKNLIDGRSKDIDALKKLENQLIEGIQFKGNELNLLDEFNQYLKLNLNEKLNKIDFICLCIAYQLNENKNLNDSNKKQISSMVIDGLNTLDTDSEISAFLIDTIIICQNNLSGQNPLDLCLHSLEQLKSGGINKENLIKFIYSEKLARILKNQPQRAKPISLNDFVENQGNLPAYLNGILDEIIELNFVKDYSKFENELSDLNSESTQKTTQIVTALKTSTPENLESIKKQIESAKSLILLILNSSVQVFLDRILKIKSPSGQIQKLSIEITKILNSLNDFAENSNLAVVSVNKTITLRNVNRANRELTMGLNRVLDIIEVVLETPKTLLDPSNHNSSIDTLSLLHVLVDRLSIENLGSTKLRSIIQQKLLENQTTSLENLKKDVTKEIEAVQKEDLELITKNMENLLKSFESKEQTFQLKTASNIIENLKNLILDIENSLSTEIIPEPSAVSDLPFRFTVILDDIENNESLENTSDLLNKACDSLKVSLNDLIDSMNKPKTKSNKLFPILNELHRNLNKVINCNERVRKIIINVGGQSSANTLALEMFQQGGDLAIDSLRARLLGQLNWKEETQNLKNTLEKAILTAIGSVSAAQKAIQSEMEAGSEAERELIAAAKAVAASQDRLKKLAEQAKSKQAAATNSSDPKKEMIASQNDDTNELINISQPILNSAGELIKAAQDQTKSLIKNNPELPNQKGLISSATELVDSLDLLIVVAEMFSNGDPLSSSKLLAASNLISGAVQRFLAECNVKSGYQDVEIYARIKKITDSIQGMIKQLRSYGEGIQDKEDQKTLSQQDSGKKMNAMIMKINAMSKVADARKEMENAEKDLKKVRQAYAARAKQ